VLRESLEEDGQVDAWEAKGEPIYAAVSDDWEDQMCLDSAGTAKTCESGSPKQTWVYKRLHGGTLSTVDGNRCLTRKSSTISVETCNDSAAQKWKRLCGAWANGDGTSGRVLEFAGSEGDAEVKVRGAQWTGKKNQLWHFKEVVHHSKCDQKAHKVLRFDGTTQSTVALRAFLSMPSKLVTVGMWIKAESGTPFSYSSKHHANAFVLSNLKSLDVFIKDHKISTGLDFTENKWTHLAASWSSSDGELKVFKNGQKVFSRSGVMKGKQITPGGCVWLGQKQNKYCTKHEEGASFNGLMTDVQIWKEKFDFENVEKMMTHPVDPAILDKLGKTTSVKTPNNQRLALLSRQYNAEEMKRPNPEICKMDAFKKKAAPKLKKVGGNMHTFTGSGDVHYRNFAREGGRPCHFDDQSVGEWVLSMVTPKYYRASPLMIQYRTSPSKTNCPWCQNGAVSYIDGCALKFGDEQVSAGFGGFHFPGVAGIDGAGPGRYPRYIAWNGKAFNGHRRGRNIEAWGYSSSLKVNVISEGVSLYCRQHSISLVMPNTFKGKVAGIAGTGMGKNHDWTQGPNNKVYKACRPGKQMPGLAGKCPRNYVYGNREHPFNGNRADKPLYKWFRTWQVDGDIIPSAFSYKGNTGPGSFNRNAGQKVKTIKDVNNRPSGKKKMAIEECKRLRATPEARSKCVFDFMVLGAQAVKDSQRDRMALRASRIKVPTVRDVRDVTKFKNDAQWAGKPGWECGDDFVAMQKIKAKEHEDLWFSRKANKRQADAQKFASCPAGFKVTAEQSEVHPQETKKCAGGMLAVSLEQVTQGRENKRKAQNEKKEEEGGKMPDRKQAFWEANGPRPAHTQEYNHNCFGLACMKAPLKQVAGPCKDSKFPHHSKKNKKVCYSDKKYIHGGANPGCQSWCCTDLSCQGMCNACTPTSSNDPEYLSSSGTAIFSSGRSVTKGMPRNDLGESSSPGRSLLALQTEHLETQATVDVSAGARHTCRDSNKDSTLSCDAIKESCEVDTVQAMCAATCGTPWAGDESCKRKAEAERQYQCKPAAICEMASPEPELPLGYRWVTAPTMRRVAKDTPAHCSTQAAIGVAVCNSGPRAQASYRKNGKIKKFQVRCGCDGGYKLIAHQTSSVDSACTPSAQEMRANTTSTIAAAYEDHEERAAAWAQACSSLKPSPKKFYGPLFSLNPIKTKAKKLTSFAAPWRFRTLHKSKELKEDADCAAAFTTQMWACDTGPMREVVAYLPGRGYNSIQVGCGCQQLRVQASFSGQVITMKDQTSATQGKCSANFMRWNTEFQAETFSDYRDRAQALADEVERQCSKSSLELNNRAAQEALKQENTNLMLNENSVHLGKLSDLRYKLKMQAVEQRTELSKCRKQHFVLAGIPMYERKTKELAKTVSRRQASRLRKELVELKAKLKAHQLNPEGEAREYLN
jgi:hypothetical protein